MEIEVKCTCCSKGCNLKIDEKSQTVTGNSCPRGTDYGMSELEYIRRRAEKLAQEAAKNN
jgi:CxxC motif-containing protein